MPVLDPFVIVLILLLEGLYVRAHLVLRRRNRSVPRGQQAAWHLGVALTAIGLLSPIDRYAEDLLSAHMAQHLLIADLAAPALLIGMRSPVLYFLPPRPILVVLARSRLRAVFRFVRRPLVALPIFVLTLYGWHFASAFEGAMRNELLHALQHESFVIAAILVWWPALEPKRVRTPGELWKIGHLLASRLASMMLGMAFVFMREPAYGGFYGDRAREHGLAPLADQQIAGALMMSLDAILVVAVLSWFFWRSAGDADRAEAARASAAV